MSVVFEGIVYSVFICICWNSITFAVPFAGAHASL